MPDSVGPAASEMGRGSRTAYRFIRILLTGASSVWFRISVSGTEHVPTTGPYILAPGAHRSIIDTPIASLTGPRVLRFMGAESYFDTPGLGWFLRAMGGFPVERATTDRNALRLAEAVLAAGEPLVVFPEGTRGEGPLIDDIKEGAAFLACRSGAPIVPVGIGGTARAMPIGARFIRPTKLTLVIGEPIRPPLREPGKVVKRSTIAAVSDELHETLQELFDRAQIAAGAA